MTITAYRKKWLRSHKAYERRMFLAFRRSIITSASRIDWDSIEEYNYKLLIDVNINDEAILEAYIDSYLKIGLIHGKKVLRDIKTQTKSFNEADFSLNYRESLSSFLRESLGLKISTVRSSLVKYLIAEIDKGMKEGLTIREIAKNMQKLVNSRSFYRWQALRIARTETTAAANYGAIMAGDTTGIPLDKVWISATDNRVRRKPKSVYDHAELNGNKIAKDELFNDSGSKLRFPGDPKGHAGSVINCRCTVALIPRRDANGDIIFS